MKIYKLKEIKSAELWGILRRPQFDNSDLHEKVSRIIADVKRNGLQAAVKYGERFDEFKGNIQVTEEEFAAAELSLPGKIKSAIISAKENIEKFHLPQKPKSYSIETSPGVVCSREFRAIENVALYIPGGTAPLPSTVLMLAVPAKIAGCKRVAALSPAKGGVVAPSVLFAAKLCGVKEFYKIGGVQGIAMLAYGAERVPKVDKIFGPGNRYVTAAKSFVSIDPDAAAIDMPAGPSEVLIIADRFANSKFIAADLLSQAEHGFDSQVLLLSDSSDMVYKTVAELEKQLNNLTRKEFAAESLKHSSAIIVNNLDEAVKISNEYAPEHLIINTNNYNTLKDKIINAGSVFLGGYTPESAGDYASGTNHSLPTNGYAKVFGGVSVESFMKQITFQSMTKDGLRGISETIINLAEVEGLSAHAEAVKKRLTK